jgi:hypothetical protein
VTSVGPESMDHVNFTVRDGHLVETNRRGLQVSKQKFKGTSFVNSYAGSSNSVLGKKHRKAAATSAPAQREFKFVERASNPPRAEGTQMRPAEATPAFNTLETGTTKQPARKRPPKPQNQSRNPNQPKGPKNKNIPPALTPETASSLSYTPSASSGPIIDSHPYSPASDDLAFIQHPQPFFTENDTDPFVPSDPDDGNASQPCPVWAGDSVLHSMPEWVQRRFERYYSLAARRIFPWEDLLAYNPVRDPKFHDLVIRDSAAVHCVLMSKFLYDAVRNRDPDSRGFAYHNANICASLNKTLAKTNAADSVTMICVANLASMGCYIGRLDHWRIHVRGLGKLVESRGGWLGLPHAIMNRALK